MLTTKKCTCGFYGAYYQQMAVGGSAAHRLCQLRSGVYEASTKVQLLTYLRRWEALRFQGAYVQRNYGDYDRKHRVQVIRSDVLSD